MDAGQRRTQEPGNDPGQHRLCKLKNKGPGDLSPKEKKKKKNNPGSKEKKGYFCLCYTKENT